MFFYGARGKLKMRYLLVAIMFISIISIGSAVEPGSTGLLITEGDSLFSHYDYSGSIAFYSQAAMADSLSFDAFWKLGRSRNILGELVPKDSQLTIFENARDAERNALKINDRNADAHFQLARAIGKIALFKGIFNSIGLAKQVKQEAERALSLDSLHDGAWHILGRWNREVGKKPKLFRVPLGLGAANKNDAVDFMQRAILLNPKLIHHHLEMGITYQEFGKKELAREEYNKCLTLPGQGPLDDKYKGEAKKYLAVMDEK
jgi:tetratricopeptide (TPR) repeat protein